jgi:hypothetical protein
MKNRLNTTMVHDKSIGQPTYALSQAALEDVD